MRNYRDDLRFGDELAISFILCLPLMIKAYKILMPFVTNFWRNKLPKEYDDKSESERHHALLKKIRTEYRVSFVFTAFAMIAIVSSAFEYSSIIPLINSIPGMAVFCSIFIWKKNFFEKVIGKKSNIFALLRM